MQFFSVTLLLKAGKQRKIKQVPVLIKIQALCKHINIATIND